MPLAEMIDWEVSEMKRMIRSEVKLAENAVTNTAMSTHLNRAIGYAVRLAAIEKLKEVVEL